MTWGEVVPVLTLLTSLIASVVIFLLPEARVRTRTVVNMSGATLKLGLIAVMLWGVFRDRGAEFRYEFRFPVLPDLDFILRADSLAMFFVTLSGLLWFLTTVYAIAYLEGSPHRRRFFGFFSLCVSATVGIALAGNLFTFVVFYELLTLSTYPLVVHRETEESRRAGRVYLVYTLTGGALLLAGAVWLHVLVLDVDFSGGASLAALQPEDHNVLRIVFVLLIAGLGVKAALIPLHGWLPQAMVAPAPVSALLHAVAVVKAGAFGIVRIVYDVYGIDQAHALGVMQPLAIGASVTIIYGSARALFQDDLKRRLAFSTISQVSYVVLGVAVLGPSSTVGGVVHLVHQGLMKVTLFFCAGNLAETLGIKKVSEMHGVGRRMPWTMAAFTAGALGMIGVPPLCGFVSKWYLGAGAIEASQYWVLLVLAASSALNAAYFLPILYVAWFCEPRGQWSDRLLNHVGATSRSVETAWGLLLPPVVTAVVAVGTGLLAGAPLSPLQWSALIVRRAYGRTVIDRGLGGDVALPSFDNLLLLLALASPLAVVCFLLIRRHSSLALWLASLAALPAVALAFLAEPGTKIDLRWLLLHMHLGVDAIGQTFLLFTSLLWLMAGVYARGYLASDPRIHRFFCFFLLAMIGNLGLVLSQDMASFYLFFAMMSFSSYPLVIHYGDEQSLHAGRVYMALVVFGEIALFAGMLLVMVSQDSLLFGGGVASQSTVPVPHVACGLILMGFAIKAGLVPLHVWLPLAHPAAPTPASAVLSGAMIKAGLLGWLRFLPVGEATMPAWGNLCLLMGLGTAFYGAIVGVTQRNAKAVLAYSSISQMGLITLGVGGGLLVPAAWPAISAAVLIYALHHGLCKGCLFLSVGVAPAAPGAAWRQRLLQLGLVIPALVLAGAPWTMGAVSKTALKYSLAALPDHWSTTLGWLLPLASVGTTLLMARFLYLIWPRSESTAEHPAATVFVSWFAMLITMLAAVWMLPPGNAPDHGITLLVETMTWTNLWPVSVGAVIAWIAWRLGSRRGYEKIGTGTSQLREIPAKLRHPLGASPIFSQPRGKSPMLPAIPPGDILCLWQQVQQSLSISLPSMIKESKQRFFPFTMQRHISLGVSHSRRILQAGEAAMGSWSWIAISLVALLGACCYWL